MLAEHHKQVGDGTSSVGPMLTEGVLPQAEIDKLNDGAYGDPSTLHKMVQQAAKNKVVASGLMTAGGSPHALPPWTICTRNRRG